MTTLYFISHPNVEISATQAITDWPLSAVGASRMRKILLQPWVGSLSAVYSSNEQKSIDGAIILGKHLDLAHTAVKNLGENDRSSTGFLEPTEFERTANEFFSYPADSIRGWETAVDAQRRIVRAVNEIDQQSSESDAIAIVSHGAVGTLLYCHLAQELIDRKWDQPGQGGGNYMKITTGDKPNSSWWQPIDYILPVN